jgi:DNA-binding NtrC family response regulator
MTYVLLVGGDVALLEGLSQSLATLGHTPRVAHDLSEARQVAASHPPLVLVADRALASAGGAELLGTPLAAGGARILYRLAATPMTPLLPALQRAVLADLTLPLERHRLAALVQSVAERARLAGRTPKHTPPESRTV